MPELLDILSRHGITVGGGGGEGGGEGEGEGEEAPQYMLRPGTIFSASEGLGGRVYVEPASRNKEACEMMKGKDGRARAHPPTSLPCATACAGHNVRQQGSLCGDQAF